MGHAALWLAPGRLFRTRKQAAPHHGSEHISEHLSGDTACAPSGDLADCGAPGSATPPRIKSSHSDFGP
jgi:hypothetical protein